MSASWDEDREGSILGTEEFNKNLENIKEGLTRSKENAVLRDRMGSYEAELSAMDEAAASKERRSKSFGDKMGDEFD